MIFPCLYVFKTLRLGDVIDDAAAVGTSVECRRQTLEPFLSGRVPDLQYYFSIIIENNFFVCEVRTNGGLEIVSEVALLKEVDKGRLADARVTNHYQLYETFPLLLRSRFSIHF